MIVQAIRTSRTGYRRLKAYKLDDNLHLYEDFAPAALIAEVVPAGYVIKKEEFKHYVKCDDLYRMQAEAAKDSIKEGK